MCLNGKAEKNFRIFRCGSLKTPYFLVSHSGSVHFFPFAAQNTIVRRIADSLIVVIRTAQRPLVGHAALLHHTAGGRIARVMAGFHPVYVSFPKKKGNH